MSPHKAVLHRVATAINGNDIDRVAEWFTEDFRLHDPKAPDWPTGHVGALRMLASVRAISPDLEAQILDMVEEEDRVAVRWRFAGTRDGEPFRGSAIAIYRFEGGRIAEDWGMLTPADWP
jgi:predicted ester cyclase